MTGQATETRPASGNAGGPDPGTPLVDFRVHPASYRHWRLSFNGPVATLTMDVDENAGLAPGYELKLNSYDLGVDIELHDAVQRLRFEHPEVRAVVLTSGKEKTFSAGANIRMLAAAPHPWKVNFCKFTNETRGAIEDATANSGQTYLAAVNGTASGGGYELALACEHIMLIDDRSSVVSLPELPLLGVLPGTGGLTRVTDKRHVRRDRADYFATRAEGIGGKKAVGWRLVDEAVSRARWEEQVTERARELATRSGRPSGGPGIELVPLRKTRTGDRVSYQYVAARLDRSRGVAEITVFGPGEDAPAHTGHSTASGPGKDAVANAGQTTVSDPGKNPPPDTGHTSSGGPGRDLPADAASLHDQGAAFWTLAMARELDDLILDLRTNELELGTWVLRTKGDAGLVLAYDQFLLRHQDDWLASEIIHYLKRTLKRLDVTSRSLIALIQQGSCFAGSLLELALAADRSFMLLGEEESAAITVGEMNLGPLPMGNGLTRLRTRFWGDDAGAAGAESQAGQALQAEEAERLGLVTFAPDDIDWDEEVRIAIEERVSFSPDALTGLEANNRFAGPETMETKIFGRLTAWQNWIFNRPNASGPDGALRRYGTGRRAAFDRKRV